MSLKCQKRVWTAVSIMAVGALGMTGTACSSFQYRKLAFFPDGDPASSKPPVIRSDYKSGEISSLCEAALSQAARSYDAIGELPPDIRDVDKTLLAFEQAGADLSDATQPLQFMKFVSTDPKMSQEAADCEDKVSQFMVVTGTRKDLYRVIKDQVPRTGAESRLLSETIRVFEKNGLKLTDEKLASVKSLQGKLVSLQNQFGTNLNNDQSFVTCTEAEMSGAPADFLARLKKDPQGNYIVDTKEADYVQFMQNVRSGDARRKMYVAFNLRAADKNTALLQSAIQLRQQIASLMGFSTWADYQIQGRMASNAGNVMSFLNNLKDKLAQKNASDLAVLLDFKKKHFDFYATDVKAWDVSFLVYQYKKMNLALDEETIRSYFPADIVVQGMFDVYSKLLGVNFREIKGAPVWAEGVKQYEISDAKSGEVIAYFYTDFYPRPLKYSHAAAFPLIGGRQLGGRYSIPVAAIVANLSPASNGKPALFSHSDVETLFHEFGHIMHGTLTRAPYSSLSGTGVPWDFVEAPSQMLENWVWIPQILTMVSGYYQDPSKKLPDDLLQKMVAAKNFNQGYNYTRQLMLALLDMTYHTTSGPVDVNSVYARLFRQVQGLEAVSGSQFPATFGHLMGGYDAGYYGYLWSEVYAQDMFTKFKAGGVLNPEIGGQYRRSILEEGNMAPATALVRDFLGREPNSNAFFDKLGIPH